MSDFLAIADLCNNAALRQSVAYAGGWWHGEFGGGFRIAETRNFY
ncbi:hypothetical protein ACQUJT_22855 [Ralstonia pseudosolanacearum]